MRDMGTRISDLFPVNSVGAFLAFEDFTAFWLVSGAFWGVTGLGASFTGAATAAGAACLGASA
jgi:hypothetical protein